MSRSLKEIRDSTYMSTRDLAKKAGVAPDTIWRIEGGRYGRLQPRVMRAIAEALGVHPSDIEEFRVDPANANRKLREALTVLITADGSLQQKLLRAWGNHLLPLDLTIVPAYIREDLEQLGETIRAHTTTASTQSQEPSLDSMNEEEAKEWVDKLLSMFARTAGSGPQTDLP